MCLLNHVGLRDSGVTTRENFGEKKKRKRRREEGRKRDRNEIGWGFQGSGIVIEKLTCICRKPSVRRKLSCSSRTDAIESRNRKSISWQPGVFGSTEAYRRTVICWALDLILVQNSSNWSGVWFMVHIPNHGWPWVNFLRFGTHEMVKQVNSPYPT